MRVGTLIPTMTGTPVIRGFTVLLAGCKHMVKACLVLIQGGQRLWQL